MAESPTILVACLATLLGAGAFVALALMSRLRDKLLTLLVAAACGCGAG